MLPVAARDSLRVRAPISRRLPIVRLSSRSSSSGRRWPLPTVSLQQLNATLEVLHSCGMDTFHAEMSSSLPAS